MRHSRPCIPLGLAAALAISAGQVAAEPVEAERSDTSRVETALPSGGDRAFYNAMLAWDRDLPLETRSAPADRMLSPPVDGGRLTSGFGLRTDPIAGGVRAHRGVDIAARHGSPVRAAAAGIVVFAGSSGGYGKLVQIYHGQGVQSRYAHLSATLAVAGATIRVGEVVGLVGSTGRSTGAHVHFEVRRDGMAVDPALPIAGEDRLEWGHVAPLPPLRQHWQGWRTDPDRLPSAF